MQEYKSPNSDPGLVNSEFLIPAFLNSCIGNIRFPLYF
jgi:hypothetical protein